MLDVSFNGLTKRIKNLPYYDWIEPFLNTYYSLIKKVGHTAAKIHTKYTDNVERSPNYTLLQKLFDQKSFYHFDFCRSNKTVELSFTMTDM